jgi:hypothetical protein
LFLLVDFGVELVLVEIDVLEVLAGLKQSVGIMQDVLERFDDMALMLLFLAHATEHDAIGLSAGRVKTDQIKQFTGVLPVLRALLVHQLMRQTLLFLPLNLLVIADQLVHQALHSNKKKINFIRIDQNLLVFNTIYISSMQLVVFRIENQRLIFFILVKYFSSLKSAPLALLPANSNRSPRASAPP